MKGVTTKDKARDGIQELRELIGELEGIADSMDDALCTWEEGDDAEARSEGKENLIEATTEIDASLSQAGYCAGQMPYDPPDV